MKHSFLKSVMDLRNKGLIEQDSLLDVFENVIEPYISELEKENAELKSKNKWYSEQVCNKECAEVWGNLTKAKDHIKKLLDCLKQDTNDPQTNYYVCQYMDKAEQFIKEIEK